MNKRDVATDDTGPVALPGYRFAVLDMGRSGRSSYREVTGA
ncbi:MAG: hypothetical protein ABI934_06830 [Actinomycetota bacterium]